METPFPRNWGKFVVDLSVKDLRDKLVQLEKNAQSRLYEELAKCGCDILPLSTRGSVSKSLREFFDRRGKTPRRAGRR